MSALAIYSSRPDPWRLLRLLLVLAVVLLVTALAAIEVVGIRVPIPEAAFLPLFLAVASAFAGLTAAAVRRSFQGTGVSLCFALALAGSATSLWLPALAAWSPSRWTVRALVLEPLFGHWATLTTGTALVLFLRLRRRHLQAGAHWRDRFGLQFLPLLVWALESTYNLDSLFNAHYHERIVILQWYAEALVGNVVALATTLLFVATIAHLDPMPRRPHGLFMALLAVTTALLDRAFTLAVMVFAWAADSVG